MNVFLLVGTRRNRVMASAPCMIVYVVSRCVLLSCVETFKKGRMSFPPSDRNLVISYVLESCLKK